MPGLYPTAYRGTFPAFSMRLALVCFYCLCVFVYVFYFIATMSFAGYFLSVLFCLLSMLISDSRFDLVWFRLSCDHGWIRSGSVNVRKQQQQQQQQHQKNTKLTYLVLQSNNNAAPLIASIQSAQNLPYLLSGKDTTMQTLRLSHKLDLRLIGVSGGAIAEHFRSRRRNGRVCNTTPSSTDRE